nr:RNA-directed DNA polymerase, eukaryota [Tanacetum cinerariifolium]
GDRGSKAERQETKMKQVTLSDHELVQINNSPEIALVKEDEQVAKQDNKEEENEQGKQQVESIHSNTGNEEKTPPIETDINKGSVMSDWSRPPGVEHFNKTDNNSSESSPQSKLCKCTTSFDRYSRKDISGISVIYELSKLIEVGEKLGYDVKGCHKSLHRLFDRIGVLMYIIVQGKWINSDEVFFMINIHGPQKSIDKLDMWNRLLEFIGNHDGNVFNAFIDDTRLFEPVLGGRNSTWMSKAGTKMCKLDRVLISQHVTDVFSDVKVTVLPRGWSDHTLIMLHYEKVDYVPVPFKLFHSWLQRDGFDDCVKMAYNECSTYYPLMPFHEKLKDENTQKNRILRQKRHQQMVQGIMIDGIWVTYPQHVKMLFHNFYKDKFDVSGSLTELPPVVPFATLSQEDSMELEKSVTLEEIRAASYWELLKEDVGNAVRCVLELFVIPRGVNSFFITLIPKIANLIHIKDFRPISLIGMQYKIIAKILANRLSKVIDKVYKKKKKKLILLKVDFEKAFDTVSWKYLNHMLLSLGFGSKWRRWIQDIEDMASHTGCGPGGLEIGSLKAFNLALLQKWRWSYVNITYSLWARVVKVIHGAEKVFDLKGCSCNGVWSSIISSYAKLHDQSIIPKNTLCHNVGDGSWKDNWNGNGPLMLRFNRLYQLDVGKRIGTCYVIMWVMVLGKSNDIARHAAKKKKVISENQDLNPIFSLKV